MTRRFSTPSVPRALGLRTTVSKLQTTAQGFIDRALAKQKNDLKIIRDADQKHVAELDAQMNRLTQQQKTILAGPGRNTSRAQLVAKIADLKSRRSLLIENYPSHTPISRFWANKSVSL